MTETEVNKNDLVAVYFPKDQIEFWREKYVFYSKIWGEEDDPIIKKMINEALSEIGKRMFENGVRIEE
jgi:hypothetical protein